MLVLPSGDRLWPSSPVDVFLAVAPIRQYQIIQRRPDEIEVKLVTDKALAAEQEKRLGAALNKHFGHRFTYSFTYVDHIPRSASGKFEDFRVELES